MTYGSIQKSHVTLPSWNLSPGLGIWLCWMKLSSVGRCQGWRCEVVWWPRSQPWLPVILVLLQWWARHSRPIFQGIKLAYVEIKETNFVAALPVKMSPLMLPPHTLWKTLALMALWQAPQAPLRPAGVSLSADGQRQKSSQAPEEQNPSCNF